MSKASEWTTMNKQRPKWEPKEYCYPFAKVTDGGGLELRGEDGHTTFIASEHAVSLARWMLDVFDAPTTASASEPPASGAHE